MTSARALNKLRGSILDWYRKHRRDLPWRRTRDPYAIWVSEVMLQQTRVEAAIPHYERFLARFPTLAALAGAQEADVLAAWSGLGYYRRARNLQSAAAEVVREHGGRVPEDPEALRSLPGVGVYTAAAIASVAYGRTAAAVDGNVIRVLARIHGLKGRRDAPSLRRGVESAARELAHGPDPGDWTQALMELGALVCLPREPRCGECPASRWCAARASGNPSRYPAPAKAAEPSAPKRRLLLVARRASSVLLVPNRISGTNGWTLPVSDVPSHTGRAAARRLADSLFRKTPAVELRARFRHRTYSEDLQFQVWEAAAPIGLRRDTAGRWVGYRELGRLPLRGPTLKALKRLAKGDGEPKS